MPSYLYDENLYTEKTAYLSWDAPSLSWWFSVRVCICLVNLLHITCYSIYLKKVLYGTHSSEKSWPLQDINNIRLIVDKWSFLASNLLSLCLWNLFSHNINWTFGNKIKGKYKTRHFSLLMINRTFLSDGIYRRLSARLQQLHC